MSVPVKILRSTITGHIPSALLSGQIAINEADGKLFWLDANGVTIKSVTLDGLDTIITGKLAAASNLSDIGNAATARSNLGLGNSATRNIGTTAGTSAAGDDSRIVGAAQKASNLADLADAAASRSNLGLGTAATKNVGVGANNVVQLDASGLLPALDGSQLINVPTSVSNVIGTLGVDHGGTGATTLGVGQILVGNGTSPVSLSSNLFWDIANGRLGVGTSSPSNKITISCALNDGLKITDGTYGAFLGPSGFGGIALGTQTNHNLIFFTNNNEQGRLDTSGNLSAYGSARSPIFYDSNNTGYYLDPASSSNLNALTTNGRLYAKEYIQFDNYTALYSPNNSAYFAPNDGSYGSWKVSGSRNGWQGLEFGGPTNGNISLMIGSDSNYVGFHANSYGWKFAWLGGALYCWDGSYGGGTQRQVLDQDRWIGSKYFGSDGTIYGTIFRDANDGNYYCDPASTTRINNLTIVGSGGRTLLATVTVSNAASLSYTSLSGYRSYEIEFDGLLPITQSRTLCMQLHGGGAFLGGTYYNAVFSYFNSNQSAGHSSSGAFIYMTYPGYFITTATGGTGISGTVRIYNTNNTNTNKAYEYNLVGPVYTTGYAGRMIGGGWYAGSQVAITGFQLYADSGNISGTARIYGYN